MARQADRVGRIGIWSGIWSTALKEGTYRAELDDAAAELDALGYGTVWLGSSAGVELADRLVAATPRITVATGILSIWEHEAADVAAQRAELERRHPGRFLLGLGVSHGSLAKDYARPYSAMVDFLDALDSAPEPVPADSRVLAALGPKMLALSRDRAAGAHPYLVTPEHTAQAREILGEGVLLAPELKVVLDTDLDKARTTARNYLAYYLKLPNYAGSLLRLGFSEDDLAGGGSDRLLDAVFAIGDADTIAARVTDFLSAGADHVAVQAVTDDPQHTVPLPQWRRLAEVLPLGG
jgi:probable F420-dependent oxidoreductase